MHDTDYSLGQTMSDDGDSDDDVVTRITHKVATANDRDDHSSS